MKKEDKELLLRDLCGRLPYGVKISLWGWDERGMEYIDAIDVLYSVNKDDYIQSVNGAYDFSSEDIKPYLFPISNMTEVIKEEIYQETGLYDIFEDRQLHIEVGTNFTDVCKLFNILNKYHFDYNGLIEKDLAIDATGLNIY